MLVATAPAFAYGLSYATASIADAVGTGPWPALLIADGVVVLICATRLAGHRHRTGSPASEGAQAPDAPAVEPTSAAYSQEKPASELRVAHWLLLGAVAAGCLLWFVPRPPTITLNGDIQNHSYFIARIINENSVDPAVVMAENPVGSSSTASFYPLATHSTIAVAQRVTDQPITDLLMAWPLLSAILTLPCGIFVLARRLMPQQEIIAGLAALVAAVASEFPYFPMYWGGVPLLIAMSLVPGVIALVLDAVDSRERSAFALAAVGVVGIVAAHTSELAVMAVILGCLALHDVLNARREGELRPTLTTWLGFAGVCGLLLAPIVSAMLRVTSENSGVELTLDDGIPNAFSKLLDGHNQPVLGLFAAAGIVLLLLRRRTQPLGRMRAAMWATAVFALLLLSTLMGGPVWELIRTVTVPWYKSWWRLTYNSSILFPLFAAAALAALRTTLEDSGRIRGWRGVAAISVTAAVLLAPSAVSALNSAKIHEPSFTPDELAMFHDLKARFDEQRDFNPDGVVLNQSNDRTPMMYALSGVPAFSGMHHFDDTLEQADRVYLLRHVTEVADDPLVQTLIRRWGVRYLLVGEAVYNDETAILDLGKVRRTAGFELLDHRGRFWLFEIPAANPPARRSG